MPAAAPDPALLERARGGDHGAFTALVGPHRRELFEHCYRMLGSLAEADDAVQEALLRAWKSFADFEAKASVRTWLFRITTNACLSALSSRPARSLPFAERAASAPGDPFLAPVMDPVWLEPLPDEPGARLEGRESVAFAFLVALNKLPPRQRAVLLFREVLEFSAAEVAQMLDESVAAVNSALQRARETMGDRPARSTAATRLPVEGDAQRELLGRYLRAWEEADLGAFISLLTTEARLSMPPMPQWFLGQEAIGAAVGGMVFVPGAKGTMRARLTRANGLPAVAVYRSEGGAFLPAGLHVLRLEGDRIAEIVAFLDGRLFPRFGLPASV